MLPATRVATGVAAGLLISACAAAPPTKPLAAGTRSEAGASVPARGCAGTLALVQSLRSPLRAAAYVPADPTLATFAADLRAVLERFRAGGDTRFTFVMTDKVNPAQLDGTMTSDLGPTLSLDYGSDHTNVTLSPTSKTGLEYAIASKLRELRLRAEGPAHKIGVLTGHNEIKLSDANLVPTEHPQKPTIRKIVEQYFPYYELVDVDLTKNKSTPVDPSLEGLLVTQPATDLADDELTRIDDFVLLGRTLAVVASAVNVAANDASMFATLSTHRLDKLLDGYGIEMRKDVVEDFGHPFKIDVMTPNGKSTMRFPALLYIPEGDKDLDTTSTLFFRVPTVPFPYASSLVLHPEMQPKVASGKLRVLARSSEKAERQNGEAADLSVRRQWRPTKLARYDIAATIDGALRSAFPERNGKVAAGRARVLVIASSHFFANPFARAAGGDEVLEQLATPYAETLLKHTILVARNVLDWATMDDELAACASASP